MVRETEIAVVGACPAGLCAALSAAGQRASVVVPDHFKQTPHCGVLMAYGDPAHELKGLSQQCTWEFVDRVARRILLHMPVLSDVRVVRRWPGSTT